MEFGHEGAFNFQHRNLSWLVAILGAERLWAQHGVVSERIDAPPFRWSLTDRRVLKDYRDAGNAEWARRYDTEHPDLFRDELKRLLHHDLVVGFELPPTVKRYLHRHDRPYVSVCIHPLRFLRDLCFGVTTNSERIATALGHIAVPDHEIADQVLRFRARFSRLRLPGYAIPEDVAVVAAQTQADSILINNGGFASWTDFPDEIQCFLHGRRTVVLLEHPFRPNAHDIAECFRSTHGVTVVSTDANSYGVMFTSSRPHDVLSLSSSLGVEADAIGHRASFLLSDPRNKFVVPGVDIPMLAPIGHGLLDVRFWLHLLSAPESHALEAAQSSFGLGDGYLRSSLDPWSYRSLGADAPAYVSRKTIIPSASWQPSRMREFLGSLAGQQQPMDSGEAARWASQNGFKLEVVGEPIEPGEIRDISVTSRDHSGALARGFHPAEDWGCWTCESHAVVSLALADAVLTQPCRLNVEMRLSAVDFTADQTPVLKISHNGRTLAWVLFRAECMSHTVSVKLVPEGTRCDIDLDYSCMIRPSDRGTSTDPRILGVGLTGLTCQLRWEPSVAESDASFEALSVWGLDPEGHVPLQGTVCH